ncbi:hypothetical protein BC629DRAFT_907815 [Irpex lacteus]|nr:hypothetical protein BC629DRAFT_907815 [Irpex lacteus]
MHRTSHGQPAIRDLVARPTASARPSHELGCYKHRHFLRLLARSAAASAFFWNEIRVMLGSPTYGQVYVAKSLILHCQFSHAQLKPSTGMVHCLGSIRRERFRSGKAVLSNRIPHCLLFDSEERVQREVWSCCAAVCFHLSRSTVMVDECQIPLLRLEMLYTQLLVSTCFCQGVLPGVRGRLLVGLRELSTDLPTRNSSRSIFSLRRSMYSQDQRMLH